MNSIYLCSGAGISSIAGITLAVDSWPLALQSYQANSPTTKTLEADITDLKKIEDAKGILLESGIDAGSLKLLMASPPCPVFSQDGEGDLLDPRARPLLAVVDW